MSNVQHLVAACAAMVLLVLVVEMRSKRVHPQAASNSLQVAARLQEVQAADNFKNLFEVPVLFYALVALALATGHAPDWLVPGAWGFVLLRYVHSAIHCSYNKVLHRFSVYAASGALLAGLWAGFLLAVLGKR